MHITIQLTATHIIHNVHSIFPSPPPSPSPPFPSPSPPLPSFPPLSLPPPPLYPHSSPSPSPSISPFFPIPLPSPYTYAYTHNSHTQLIYERLFKMVVNRINKAVEVCLAKGSPSNVISVLDIYGFEVFGVNRCGDHYGQMVLS